MTTEEFSNEFDTLLDSFNKDGNNLKLDEYEKSVYLTAAQEELVISYYNGANSTNTIYEKDEEVRSYLTNLVTISTIDNFNKSDNVQDAVIAVLNNDLLYIIQESVVFNDTSITCNPNDDIQVVPVKWDYYSRIIKNPFKRYNKKRVLRLDGGNNNVLLCSKYNIGKYIVKYIRKPNPIILIDLPSHLSINNTDKVTECELNPILHRQILLKAMQLAVVSKASQQVTNNNK